MYVLSPLSCFMSSSACLHCICLKGWLEGVSRICEINNIQPIPELCSYSGFQSSLKLKLKKPQKKRIQVYFTTFPHLDSLAKEIFSVALRDFCVGTSMHSLCLGPDLTQKKIVNLVTYVILRNKVCVGINRCSAIWLLLSERHSIQSFLCAKLDKLCFLTTHL